MQTFTVTHKGNQGDANASPIEVKESQAGGPRTELVAPGESKDFTVHGSSRVTITVLRRDKLSWGWLLRVRPARSSPESPLWGSRHLWGPPVCSN